MLTMHAGIQHRERWTKPGQHRESVQVRACTQFGAIARVPAAWAREQSSVRQCVQANSDTKYTDKPIPNAFWRTFSALLYVVPGMDTYTLGMNVYHMFPPSIILSRAVGASPLLTRLRGRALASRLCTAASQRAAVYDRPSIGQAGPSGGPSTFYLPSQLAQGKHSSLLETVTEASTSAYVRVTRRPCRRALLPLTVRAWWHIRCACAGNFLPLYYSHPYVPLIIFFVLFLALIKNKRLHHFVRFNAMQAMMLDIMVMLPLVANNYFPGEIFYTPIALTIYLVCFFTLFVALTYSVLFTLAGVYADVPYVSEAAYMQVWQIEFL